MIKTLIGLDIGTYSLKVVALKKTKKELSLLFCGIKSVPKDALLENQHVLVKNLFREAKITGDKVIVSSSGKDVIVRYDVFPAMTKAAFIHSLKFEHERYIPFPLSECVVDVDITDRQLDGTMDVLIVSAKKTYIQNRINLIKKSGLLPQSITTNAIALYRCFMNSSFCSATDSFILLDVGFVITTFVIVKHGKLIFSRDINIGGDNFNRSIADNLEISLDDAEKLKLKPQGSSVTAAVSINLNFLISEIELSVAYSRKNHNLGDIKCVYISGGSSKLSGLPDTLGTALEMKIDFWNPFLELKKEKSFDILESHFHNLIMAFGIALS